MLFMGFSVSSAFPLRFDPVVEGAREKTAPNRCRWHESTEFDPSRERLDLRSLIGLDSLTHHVDAKSLETPFIQFPSDLEASV
jgi:hypothetical protein